MNRAEKIFHLLEVGNKVKVLVANKASGGTLNAEWGELYGKSKKEPTGPFWDTSGEKNPKYYVVRDSEGGIVAGATTVEKGLTIDLLSLASHKHNYGKAILDEIKKKSLFITTLASSDAAKKFYQDNGFFISEKPGQYNLKWKRK